MLGPWGAPLLSSKLRPPSLSPQVIARPALLARMTARQDAFLTLVRSPAGYGKTTALVQYWQSLEARGARTAWLSFDEDDRDPDLFLAYFIHVLSGAGLSDEISGRVRVESGLPEAVTLNRLLNLLERDGPRIFLFLDDYHLAEGRELDRLLERLLRRPLNRLRLILSSRTQPAFPLSRQRAEGHLCEITERELRFGDRDIAALFAPAFSVTHLELLARRTEGWPVALQLARIWMERQADAPSLITAFSGSAAEMASYLAEQIVAGLPEKHRQVLLATSIVEEVNGDIADDLTDSEDCAAILLDLARMNVPIFAIDGRPDTYRYHPIFREFLEAQLNLHGATAVRTLHRRASRYFVRSAAVTAAIQHAVAAGDTEQAFHLAEGVSWVRRIISGHLSDLRRVLAVLPFDEALQRPRLALAQAYLDCKNGDIRGGARILAHARNLLHAPGGTGNPSRLQKEIKKDLLLLEALYAGYLDHGISSDDVRSIEQLLNEADSADYGFRALVNNILGLLHYRSGSLLAARATFLASITEYDRAGVVYGRLFVNIHLAMVACTQGCLREAQASCDQARDIAQRYLPSDDGVMHRLGIFEAEIHYQRNQVEAAKEILFEALPAAEHTEGWPELHVSAFRTAASIAFHERGLAAAEEVLAQGIRIADHSGYQRLTLHLIILHVTFLDLSGNFERAEQLAAAHGLAAIAGGGDHPAVSWREREEAAACLARLALGTGDAETAERLLAPAEERCLTGDFGRRLIQTRLLRALAKRAAGDMDGAVYHLKQALADAREEGFIRIFVDEGEAARDLLTSAVVHLGVAGVPEALYDWISELLIAFDSPSGGKASGLAELVLTARELEILQSLQLGGSNKEIARRLDMTDNAVKFHMKNLFRKLGVNTRQLAAAVAEKRGLIAPQKPVSEAG